MNTVPDVRGDHYIELLRDSRGLSTARNELRELWFNGLELPNKEEVLFELEMLLKGVVCFGDDEKHPGPRKREPAESRQFHEELGVLQLASERIIDLCEQLLLPEDRQTNSDIYLTSGVLASLGGPLLKEPLEQETPEASLRLLHRAFKDFVDVMGVMARLDRIPYRGFASVVAMAGREVARNLFFNPLVGLEFRTEYDHLQHLEILHIVYGGGPEGAQRSATLSFLAFYRMMHYLAVAESYLGEASSVQLASVPMVLLRSDGQALANFMRQEARRWLSSGFEREVMTLSAKEIIAASEGLTQDYMVLHELGATLRGIGDQLQLELRKAFEQSHRPLSELLASPDFVSEMAGTIGEMKGFLMQAVVRVAKAFKPELEGPQLFDDFIDERVKTERLRREMWMFAQIMRGFLAKAAAAPESANRWFGQSSYRFVRDFIEYFRNLGYHLLRSSGYGRIEEFMTQLEALSASDVIDQDSVDLFVHECEGFRGYLLDSFKALGTSPALAGVDFDRQSAAETLRLYLDRG